ncbi:uncharacterized protein V6R79_007828 [Siganus canaliculatus]
MIEWEDLVSVWLHQLDFNETAAECSISISTSFLNLKVSAFLACPRPADVIPELQLQPMEQ